MTHRSHVTIIFPSSFLQCLSIIFPGHQVLEPPLNTILSKLQRLVPNLKADVSACIKGHNAFTWTQFSAGVPPPVVPRETNEFPILAAPNEARKVTRAQHRIVKNKWKTILFLGPAKRERKRRKIYGSGCWRKEAKRLFFFLASSTMGIKM